MQVHYAHVLSTAEHPHLHVVLYMISATSSSFSSVSADGQKCITTSLLCFAFC